MKIKTLALLMASTALIPALSFAQYKDEIFIKKYEYVPPHRLEVGIMMGDMRSSRSATITTPFLTSFNGSQTTNNYELGLQLKLFLASLYDLNTFVYFNAENIFNSSNLLVAQQTFPVPLDIPESTVTLRTGYVLRLGVGLDTDPFDGFTATVGGGVAVVNQKITTSISELSVFTNSVSNNTFVPTIMVGLNYQLCNFCISGHPLIISGEVTVEQYPDLKLTTGALFGNYLTNVPATWQFHTDLVLGTRF